ncbi:MAG: cupin domain-containing protein, partial [Candidatus Marinimicrobia bacterium]|nr:cupin domain-containing protein [Candidatus Neomarinimicrobiota bacterium]
MKQLLLAIFLILNINAGLSANLHAADLIHLNKSVFVDLGNTEFETYNEGYGELTAREYELFTSEDENFSIGIWEAKRGEEVMDTPYPYNEFMYVLFGQMVLKSSDGQTIIINPGQGFVTPKDWVGSFTITEDLALIYAIDGLKQTKND